MPFIETELPSLDIALESEATGRFDPGLPVLAGEVVENIFGPARAAGCAGVFALFQTEAWLLGATTVPLTAGLEAATRQIYEEMLQATRGLHLARIWNYVPAINASGPEGLENYRSFCSGRSRAFEQHHGRGFNARLPAASAVGCQPAELTVVFAAGATRPLHVENPLQLPAYDYPHEHGPRAPSFARATMVTGEAGSTVFISGTAAIRGHATIAPGRPREQLDCTLENIRELSLACGLGPALDQGGGSTRHFKVYVRHAADQPAVAASLEERLLVEGDRVTYLLADICRTSLLVEIEATLFGVNTRV